MFLFHAPAQVPMPYLTLQQDESLVGFPPELRHILELSIQPSWRVPKL